jgi:hypothetical protein
MTDGRILEWLTVTEEALAAPSDRRAEALIQLHERREALRQSLLAEPVEQGPDSDLVARLENAEKALAEAAAAERTQLEEALKQVREQKRGTTGYRPVRPRRPVFVSRKA